MKPSILIAFIPTAALCMIALCQVGTTIPARAEQIVSGEIVVVAFFVTVISSAFGYIAAKVGGES